MTSGQSLHFKITRGFMFKDHVYSIILLNILSFKKKKNLAMFTTFLRLKLIYI